MCRKKNLPLLAIFLALLIFTLVGGASARKMGGRPGNLYYRLPCATDIPTPFVLEYEYPYATSAEALEAVKAWNDVAIPEYYAKLDEWKVQYEAVLAKAKRTVGAPDESEHFVLGPCWDSSELKYCIAWYDKHGFATCYPEYELPVPPEFDVEPYEKAISAYCYMMSDGLTRADWSFSKCILCWFDAIKTKRGGALDTQGNDEKLVRMRKRGYLTVTEAQTDLALTADGFVYFKGLIEKLADFRATNIAIGAEKGAITPTEAKNLNEANEAIKVAFLQRLDAIKGGSGKAKKGGGLGKLFGKKGGDDDWRGDGPEFLREDLGRFEVDKKGSALSNPPYRRVLESVPVPDMSLDLYFFDPEMSDTKAKPHDKAEALCKYLGLEIPTW